MTRKNNKSVYLGISGVSSHDAAAALIIDGKVIAAAEEERFNREKHTGCFPQNAIDYCLREGGIQPKDVDRVAYYFNPIIRYIPSLRFNVRTAMEKSRRIFSRNKSYNEVFNAFLKAAQVEYLIIEGIARSKRIVERDFGNARFIPVNHHDAHAASAFFVSPFDTSLVLTVDLIGEWDTTSWYDGENNRLRKRGAIVFPHSLGKLYQTFTKFLGFKPNSDEYKVMGLSAYGSDRFVPFLRTLYHLNEDGGFQLNRDVLLFCKGIYPEWDQQITSVLGMPREKDSVVEERHKDIAYAIQFCAEEILLHLLKKKLQETSQRNVCIAGGVALNALANQKIRESGLVESLFIQPAANDAGTALGAALWVYFKDHPLAERTVLQNYYLGPQYCSREITEVIRNAQIQYASGEDMADKVVDHLTHGKVVGLFQGRMEFGPRALGNRSILADPRDKSMKDKINTKIKFRESFRPFAPSILEEAVNEYFINGKCSPFMTQTFTATTHARLHIPATVHVDGTSRIQTVTQESNPLFYHLIELFAKKTSIPVLLNTSFNVAGEPIVCTPQDALRTFKNSGIDVLLIENILLEK